MHLREYRPTDAAALLALFRDTVHRINARDYSAEQLAAWAPAEIDLAGWGSRFVGRYAIVAIEEQVPVGFTELEPDGHIDRFYVAADHQGKGIGHHLLQAIVAEAIRRECPRLYLEASITARPFFEVHGFRSIAEQTVSRRGVELVNYRMERILTP